MRLLGTKPKTSGRRNRVGVSTAVDELESRGESLEIRVPAPPRAGISIERRAYRDRRGGV